MALDVGYGQLAWELRTDPRVTVMDRTNVRELRSDVLPLPAVTRHGRVPFISLISVVAPLVDVSGSLADLVFLIPPQFEAGREQVEDGGVVRDPVVWRRSIEAVSGATRAAGSATVGVIVSPVKGPAGNVEFLLHSMAAGESRPLDIDGAIEAARGAGDIVSRVAFVVHEGRATAVETAEQLRQQLEEEGLPPSSRGVLRM